jgi:hypothetical protein
MKLIQVNHDGKKARKREREIWGERESITAVRENGVG